MVSNLVNGMVILTAKNPFTENALEEDASLKDVVQCALEEDASLKDVVQ
jgi:hypothetical protein